MAIENKIAWLVDIGYVVKVGSKRFKLDYSATEVWLSERYGPTATFLFNGFDRDIGVSEGLHKFYDAMRAGGMTVSLSPMTGTPGAGDHRQRRVDVDLASHLVWQASLPHVKRIVATTGDQDFRPAIDIARHRCGKAITLLTYAQDVSNDLIAGADEHVLLDDYREALTR